MHANVYFREERSGVVEWRAFFDHYSSTAKRSCTSKKPWSSDDLAPNTTRAIVIFGGQKPPKISSLKNIEITDRRFLIDIVSHGSSIDIMFFCEIHTLVKYETSFSKKASAMHPSTLALLRTMPRRFLSAR
jgi:hypothetical protein